MTAETVTGMVISSQNIGETDRRIVLLTKEKGRISAFARGAVKPKNPLVSATQPFTFGEFFIYPGRDSYTVTKAEVSRHFDFVRKSLDKYYYASYMCELAGYYTRENLDAKDVLLLLYRSFQALMADVMDNNLIRYIYEWRILLINGEMPDVFRCRICGSESITHFSVKKQCVLCSKCAQGADDAVKLMPSLSYTFQYIASTPLDKLYSFKVSDEVFARLKYITDRYVKMYRDHEFKSLQFIEGTVL